MHQLAPALVALACQLGAPLARRIYAEELPDAARATKRFKVEANAGPFIVTSIHAPGVATYPATATLELEDGRRQFTDGAVRASCAVQAGAAGVSAAAALGAHYAMPAPIVIEEEGQLVCKLAMDTVTIGAGQLLRVAGFHTSGRLAQELRDRGEFYAFQLAMDFSAADTSEKDDYKMPDDVQLDRMWHEETAAGGAITDLSIALDNLRFLGDSDASAGILAPYPMDPRAELGVLAPKGARLVVNGKADGAGDLTSRIVVVGRRVYG